MIFDFFDKFIDIFILNGDTQMEDYTEFSSGFSSRAQNAVSCRQTLEIPILGNIASDNFDSFIFKFRWIFTRRIDRSCNDVTTIIFQILS